MRETKPAWRRWRQDGGAWQDGEPQGTQDSTASTEGTGAEQQGAARGREGLGNESILEAELSNGLKVNLLRTKHQPKQCNVLITALGSESAETHGPALPF